MIRLGYDASITELKRRGFLGADDQPAISRAFPPSNMVYSLLGMKPVMPGEGMALDSLRAEIADGTISMRGTIINLRETDMKVPAVMASIVDGNEKIIDQMLIPPPIASILEAVFKIWSNARTAKFQVMNSTIGRRPF